MSETTKSVAPRREFLKKTARLAALSALTGAAIPRVHAGEDNTIRLAIVGSGDRGSGAVGNALSATGGPAKLVAMADLFPDRLEASHKALSKAFGDKIDVPKDRQFLGFDAYRHAIDCLRPGDMALLTTHAAFRAMHLEYAVQKGVHVFMEKTFAPDPAGVRRILRAGEAAEKKNLKIAAGLMCRHSSARQAMIQRIRDGALGQILLIRAYRMSPDYFFLAPRNPHENELLTQIRRPYEYFWASSGIFIELMIHQIDECCWVKDSWPIAAHGVGGRTAGSSNCSQNLDSYSIEYTFADGARRSSPAATSPTASTISPRLFMERNAPGSSPATFMPRRCKRTRTSGSPPTTSTGSPQRKESVPTRPSGTCSWIPSGTTARTTRPGGRPSQTWLLSWVERPFTRGRSSRGMKRWPLSSSSARALPASPTTARRLSGRMPRALPGASPGRMVRNLIARILGWRVLPSRQRLSEQIVQTATRDGDVLLQHFHTERFTEVFVARLHGGRYGTHD